MVTLFQALDIVMQLTPKQQVMLIDIIGKRLIEVHRNEIAESAKEAVEAFERRELDSESAEELIRRLHFSLQNEPICFCCEHDVPTTLPRVCPICNHTFAGNGWDGIDAHWRAKHERISSYEEFWNSLCKDHK